MDWTPTAIDIESANISALMRDFGVDSASAFHRWTVDNRSLFWSDMADRLNIVFRTPPHAVAEGPATNVTWFPGATLNIAESCFVGDPDRVAVRYETRGTVADVSVGELRSAVARTAGGLRSLGVGAGTPVAIAMPMTYESVVAYLAVVWAGGVVVSIADSFAPSEIRTRLQIADCSLVITQDTVQRGGKTLPMYEKVIEAGAVRCVVVGTDSTIVRRPDDASWSDVATSPPLEVVVAEAGAYTNILFSSGTTGEPKAIPWSHTTPLKAAADGHIHQDIRPGDVVAWPTNLGWMMGPWLIYASLLNGATMALSDLVPTSADFLRFVRRAEVTVLGVVPALVRAWRADPASAGVDWSLVRVISSTGEASTPADMRWLMTAAGAPVIEYCGGTEIGGGYISSTVVEPFDASTFTTPCAGLDLRILDDLGRPSDEGQVFIVPPSIGLSTELLNRDHYEVYYAGVPQADVPLRRHGDQMWRLATGHWRAMGRSDDTMNLGGIKVSSAEIERVVSTVEGVLECAAVGVPPDDGGPDVLHVFTVATGGDEGQLRDQMQVALRSDLNPLFKIAAVHLVAALPRTASAKVMRRTLRDQL